MKNFFIAQRHLHICMALIIVLLFALSACTIRLISEYDENIDRGATALHKSFESFFFKIESQSFPACNYDNHKDFYDQSKVDISALKLRAEAIPKNDNTIKQIKTLADSLNLLEQLHQTHTDNCLLKEEVAVLRTNFNVSLGAIIKLELAKKKKRYSE